MRGKPEHSIKEAQRRHRLDRPLPGSVAKLTQVSSVHDYHIFLSAIVDIVCEHRRLGRQLIGAIAADAVHGRAHGSCGRGG